VAGGHSGDLLGEGRFPTVVGVAELPPELQVDDHAPAAHRLIMELDRAEA
jgi:hypothetical protein